MRGREEAPHSRRLFFRSFAKFIAFVERYVVRLAHRVRIGAVGEHANLWKTAWEKSLWLGCGFAVCGPLSLPIAHEAMDEANVGLGIWAAVQHFGTHGK